MTGAERILQVFLDMRPPDRALLWMADRLLDLAAELPAVRVLRFPPTVDRPDDPPAYEFSDGESKLVTTTVRVARTFRSLLPRFAVLGSLEMGIDPPLYGGHVRVTRVIDGRPVVLDVVFSNTLASQRVEIARVHSEVRGAVNGTAARLSVTDPAG